MLTKDMTIKEVQDHIKSIDHHPDAKLLVMLKLVEEVGELAVEIRRETSFGLTDERLANIKYELYDVLHFVNHLANIYDISLVDAIIEKDKINEVKYNRKEALK